MVKAPLLIVDDEPANLAVIREILGDCYRLAMATSGSSALTAARRLEPGLILLDIQLPDIDGYQVCRRLKADPATGQIPVIFVTSLGDPGDEEEGFAAGAVDYITKPISPPILRARVRTHLSLVGVTRLEQSWHDAIHMLGVAGHYNDVDTGVHVWRMAAYARALAAACGWSQEECTLLESAAPMHDTGKIGIPGQILRNPGQLDAEEWRVMQNHTRIGHSILSKSDAPVFRLAAEVALRHHERWDGSGYPDGLAGEQIPESARIIAIADVFDALTMRRPYKEPWPVAEAMAWIRRGAGTQFEPRLVELFASILPEVLEIRAYWQTQDPAHA